MRYVVTGAAGFIGSQLATSLQEAGHEVVGVDCFTDYYDIAEQESNARGIDVRRVDLAEQPLDLDGIDGVFHLAAQAGVRSFGEVFPTYVRRNPRMQMGSPSPHARRCAPGPFRLRAL